MARRSSSTPAARRTPEKCDSPPGTPARRSGADLAHADLLEREDADLDEGVARELAELAGEGAAGGVAVALDGGERLLLEAREVAREQPVGERDAAAGEAEARALAGGDAARVVGAHGGGDLRLDELRVAGEAAAALRRLGDLPERDGARVAIEGGEDRPTTASASSRPARSSSAWPSPPVSSMTCGR